MNSGGNTGPGCVVSVLVSCDRLISPGYGKGIGNRPFSLFPVETLIENFATCGLRPTGWPVTSSRCVTGRIGARSVPNLNLDPRTIRHASFRRGSRPRLPSSLPWMGNIEGMDEKLETIPVVETHVRLTRTLFYLICLFLFLSILLSFLAEFDTGFCSLKRERNFAVHGDCFVALDEYSSITFATIIFLHFRRFVVELKKKKIVEELFCVLSG